MKITDFWPLLLQLGGTALVVFLVYKAVSARKKKSEKPAIDPFEVELIEQGFRINKKVAFRNCALYMDDEHKRWSIRTPNHEHAIVYPFSSLRKFSMRDNGEVVVSRDITGMAVGALMFGVIGALIGGGRIETDTCKSMELSIEADGLASEITATLLGGNYARSSQAYEDALDAAHQMLAILAYIQGLPPEEEVPEEAVSNPEPLTEIEDIEGALRALEERKANGAIGEKEYQIQRGILLRRI